jgi:hypothetical protein
MTSSEPPGGPVPPADDTAAFQRFYRADAEVPDHGWLYRLLVGWWRRDA